MALRENLVPRKPTTGICWQLPSMMPSAVPATGPAVEGDIRLQRGGEKVGKKSRFSRFFVILLDRRLGAKRTQEEEPKLPKLRKS